MDTQIDFLEQLGLDDDFLEPDPCSDTSSVYEITVKQSKPDNLQVDFFSEWEQE
jgi:hypothetical protein